MRYAHVVPAVFVRRPNRFIAQVLLNGAEETVHVKNTGRCRELLIPGVRVWLSRADKPGRKTAFDLIAVEKGGRLINMDAAAPNAAFAEYARAGRFLPGGDSLRAEVACGASRFDFSMEADGTLHYIEVKGVTLEENGLVRFPDAPTLRGVKHLRELTAAKAAGLGAHVVFIVQMSGILGFMPNDRTHPAFGEALREAARAGVDVQALECAVTPDEMEIVRSVPVLL
ncbi:MAG: DNA/RNA nuclease SfsA [Clostridia bacterium]|nr:DNA/RNA nuclease SfsA [Clostridia bacterium]